TELKKREEAEIAASVRAASRSIQARRLLRERETAREVAANAEQAAANTVIGQGPIPAGWAEQAAAKKAARELEKKAAEALKDAAGGAHGSAGAFRELMVIVREVARGDLTRLPGSFSRLLGMLGLGIGQMVGIGLVAAEIGAIAVEFNKMREAQAEERETKQRLDDGRQAITDRLVSEIGNLGKSGRISAREAEDQQDLLKYYQLNGTDYNPEIVKKAQAFIKAHGGVVTDKDLKEMQKLDEEHERIMAENRRERMAADQREVDDKEQIAALQKEMSGLDKATIEYKEKQLKLDQLQRDLLKDQKELVQQKANEQRKAQEEQRVYDQAKLRMHDIEQREREQFMPTLEELAHHGRFGTQARGIGRLERRIKRDFERGDIAGADRDIAARNKLYDSLADRGVVAERADRREIKELTAKMHMHIAAIAQGHATVKTTI